MKLAAIAIVVGGLAAGMADDAAAQAPRVCLPRAGKPRLVVRGLTVTACTADDAVERCVGVAPGKPPVEVAPPPAMPTYTPSRLVQSSVNGTWRACAGSQCRPLGARALAAVTAVSEDPMQVPVDLTADGQVVVVDRRRAFAIAADRELVPTPPREYAQQPPTRAAKPVLIGFGVLGNLVLASWSDCAGPCGHSVVVDREGRTAGAWFVTGMPFVLGGGRGLVVPTDDHPAATFLDTTTGKQLGAIELGIGVLDDLAAARLDDRTGLAMWRRFDATFMVAWITLPAGKPPAMRKVSVPACD